MHPIFSPNAQLLCFLEEEIVNHRGNYHELFQDYATDDLFGNRIPCTLLQKALNEGKSDKVILKLVEIGGSELVKKRSINGETALHFACMAQFSQSLHVISKLIEIGGGRETVMVNDVYEITALHAT